MLRDGSEYAKGVMKAHRTQRETPHCAERCHTRICVRGAEKLPLGPPPTVVRLAGLLK